MSSLELLKLNNTSNNENIINIYKFNKNSKSNDINKSNTYKCTTSMSVVFFILTTTFNNSLNFHNETRFIPTKYIMNNSNMFENNITSNLKEKDSNKKMTGYNNNIIKLEELRGLDNGWDNDDAIKIDVSIIDKLGIILRDLRVQPEIFPLVNGNIQFEYEEEDGRYLEFETVDINNINVFKLDSNDKTTTKEIKFNLEDILKEVEDFYGC